jgi:glycyl-tRNA synthetase beta chain
MADLLIELGCEELPASASVPLTAGLAEGLHKALVAAGLVTETAAPVCHSTPRRMAVYWPEVGERQADQQIERRGPAVKAAWQDGEVGGTPSKALAGFLLSAGASVDDIVTVETPKGVWVAVNVNKTGQTIDELLAESLPDVLGKLPMPRRMHWGGDVHEFLRPAVWLLALHGKRVLDVEALGLKAARTTLGHRVHSPGPHEVAQASDYLAVLERAYVLADVAVRRSRIIADVTKAAKAAGGTAVSDEALVDEVTSLVEWPVALAGKFEERFLKIPKEALIQTMQENQRYFALLDASGELMPGFVTVANLESADPSVVIDGNERVIRPRFDDTMFFWNQDASSTLADRRDDLGRVLFEETLGSVGDKVTRMQTLCAVIAPITGAQTDQAERAAGLSKCDLVSEIVKELAKMQGIAGRYYALRDGEPADVALAVEQHYWPKQAGTALPSNAIGTTVALADRLDTLVGIFGIGRKPTGAKDPFALRRAAIALLRMAIEGKLDLDMDVLIGKAADVYSNSGVTLAALDQTEISRFVRERLRVYLTGESNTAGSLPGDVVDAVLAQSVRFNPFDISLRAVATAGFRAEPAAISLSAAAKRIGNLLEKSAGNEAAASRVDAALFTEDAERDLASAVDTLKPDVAKAMQQGDYVAAMRNVATLAEPVERFFNEVMVMAEDSSVRANRLGLLRELSGLANGVADLSRLAPQDADSAS